MTTQNPQVDIENVRQIARLARIALDESELEGQRQHFERLLGLVATISEVDTVAVAPMVHPLDLVQPLRADEPQPTPGAEPLMALAPEAAEDHYLVPRVVE